jgi:glutaminase
MVDTEGNVYEIGDTGAKVSIQSISKVFTAALVMSQRFR